MSVRRGFLAWFAICLSTLASPNQVFAQAETPVDTTEFLSRYRAAIPKIERALYRNKHIKVVIRRAGPDQSGKIATYQDTYELRSNLDRYIMTNEMADGSSLIKIVRPDHLYALVKPAGVPYKITNDRALSQEESEQYLTKEWWSHAAMSTGEGLGHGITEQEENWYKILTDGDVPILRVVETTDNGRRIYRLDAGKPQVWRIGGLSLYFDYDSLLVYNAKFKNGQSHDPELRMETSLDFEMKPGDYDSIVLKSYKFYVENKQLGIPRHLQNEHIYSVYKNATHPPETFRLEQFGLPDVAERSRGTSRRSLGFLVAGLILGGLLLVAWRRGRRAAKPA